MKPSSAPTQRRRERRDENNSLCDSLRSLRLCVEAACCGRGRPRSGCFVSHLSFICGNLWLTDFAARDGLLELHHVRHQLVAVADEQLAGVAGAQDDGAVLALEQAMNLPNVEAGDLGSADRASDATDRPPDG